MIDRTKWWTRSKVADDGSNMIISLYSIHSTGFLTRHTQGLSMANQTVGCYSTAGRGTEHFVAKELKNLGCDEVCECSRSGNEMENVCNWQPHSKGGLSVDICIWLISV